MIYSTESDLVPFFRGIVYGLQPYAKANDIRLSLSSVVPRIGILFQPFILSQAVIHIICCQINLLPPKSRIQVRLSYSEDLQYIAVDLQNSTIDLNHLTEINYHSDYSFSGRSVPNGSVYTLLLPLHPKTTFEQANSERSLRLNDKLPQFYREIQKRFTKNFTQTEKIIASLERNRPWEAAFIQKINTLISANLSNEKFDSEALGKVMLMSRTQLFRKMKQLVRQAPANYIKTFRLQKAKELLETTDLTVSEVAFNAGFLTINHFTRIFKIQYGIPPSVYRSRTIMQQNDKILEQMN